MVIKQRIKYLLNRQFRISDLIRKAHPEAHAQRLFLKGHAMLRHGVTKHLGVNYEGATTPPAHSSIFSFLIAKLPQLNTGRLLLDSLWYSLLEDICKEGKMQ